MFAWWGTDFASTGVNLPRFFQFCNSTSKVRRFSLSESFFETDDSVDSSPCSASVEDPI